MAPVVAGRWRTVGDPRVGGSHTNRRSAELNFLIRARLRAIQDATEKHNRRLEEMRAERAAMLNLYAGNHPSIVALDQRIASLQASGSPQVQVLQKEVKEMERNLERMGGGPVPYPDEPVPDPYSLERVLLGLLPGMLENPGVRAAMDEVQAHNSRLQTTRNTVNDTKNERKAVQASFKYRYTVFTPAKFPRTPLKPNAKVIALGSILAGLLLGLFAAIARDVFSGRLLQPWQVKRGLGLPVLAEMEPLPLESQSF